MTRIRYRLLAALVVAALALFAANAGAFTHVVQKNETLAQIAERTYGRIQYEKILVAANALDAHGGSSIVPGQRLEIPAVGYYRVTAGETWASLATQLLGDGDVADICRLTCLEQGVAIVDEPDIPTLEVHGLKVLLTSAEAA